MGLFPHKLTSLFETLEEPWSLTSSLWLAVEETKERKRLSAKSVSRSFCSTFPGSVCHGTQLILSHPPPSPPITCHSQICWERLSAQPKCDSGGSALNPSACTKACCLTAGHGNRTQGHPVTFGQLGTSAMHSLHLPGLGICRQAHLK